MMLQRRKVRDFHQKFIRGGNVLFPGCHTLFVPNYAKKWPYSYICNRDGMWPIFFTSGWKNNLLSGKVKLSLTLNYMHFRSRKIDICVYVNVLFFLLLSTNSPIVQ